MRRWKKRALAAEAENRELRLTAFMVASTPGIADQLPAWVRDAVGGDYLARFPAFPKRP